jgi:hypothetical protein
VTGFILGAVVGALLMLAVLLRRFERKVDEAYWQGKHRTRTSCAGVVLELQHELRRLQGVHLFTPYPRHAPMRAAWAGGFRAGLKAAEAHADAARTTIVGRDEAGRPLHPSEHAA